MCFSVVAKELHPFMIEHFLKRASTDEQTHEPAKITAEKTALKTARIIIRLPPEITLLLLTVFSFHSPFP